MTEDSAESPNSANSDQADSAESPDSVEPGFVVTNEPDVDTETIVAMMRKAGRAWGVRPHPDRVERLRAHLDELRGGWPDDLYRRYERSAIMQLQVEAITAYVAAAGSGDLHILTEDGVTTAGWDDPPGRPGTR
ncbi:hypothetical protein BJF85_08565 [Saccharomonospora sp. CUA-673]|uniref:hypothetical protein n=1 Tax=Saccharomonospora sp. CUA-673 TaxID=1904969 RepID=UPI0009621267|nr:hypothetical protein [Saccharomonospora sp. CUA-673]OLT38723.1 hypothetical protein BJF85_08565 [Saccharomonospora sp. CUA-673]